MFPASYPLRSAIVLAMISLAGCSQQSLYDFSLEYQREQCNKQPASARDECLKKLLPFHEYEKEREAL